MKRASLTPTSALVTLWGGAELFKSESARDFFHSLDLSAGDELRATYDKIFPDYHQVIKNRKTAVHNWCREIVSTQPDSQVVVLAAGYDPLSVELQATFPRARVFDVDRDAMADKQELIKRVAANAEVKCVTADLANADALYRNLTAAGFAAAVTTVVIAEGISYYLPAASLWNAAAKFARAGANKNWFVLEYGVPHKEVNAKFYSVYKQTTDALEASFEFGKFTTYADADVQKNFARLGGRVQDIFSMREIETHWNRPRTFHRDDDGWIRVCRGRI